MSRGVHAYIGYSVSSLDLRPRPRARLGHISIERKILGAWHGGDRPIGSRSSISRERRPILAIGSTWRIGGGGHAAPPPPPPPCMPYLNRPRPTGTFFL